MFIATRTLFGIMQDTAKMLGKDYIPLPNTTLNEKYSVGDPYMIGNPVMNVLTIGLKPVDFYADNNFNLLDLKHSATDGSVYEPIPFSMREVGDELSSVFASKYRLRTIKNIGGKEYVCYYGYSLSTFKSDTKLYRLIRDDVNKYGLFELDIRDINVLNPNIQTTTPYTQFKTNDYVTAIDEIEIKLASQDLLEIKNVIDIMFPGREYVIGEFGIVSSIDDGKEVHSAQTTFLCTSNVLIDNILATSKPYLATITLGGMEMKMDRE